MSWCSEGRRAGRLLAARVAAGGRGSRRARPPYREVGGASRSTTTGPRRPADHQPAAAPRTVATNGCIPEPRRVSRSCAVSCRPRRDRQAGCRTLPSRAVGWWLWTLTQGEPDSLARSSSARASSRSPSWPCAARLRSTAAPSSAFTVSGSPVRLLGSLAICLTPPRPGSTPALMRTRCTGRLATGAAADGHALCMERVIRLLSPRARGTPGRTGCSVLPACSRQPLLAAVHEDLGHLQPHRGLGSQITICQPGLTPTNLAASCSELLRLPADPHFRTSGRSRRPRRGPRRCRRAQPTRTAPD